MGTKKNRYTPGYFIKKFEAIPAKHWTCDTFKNEDGQCCALGHCGFFENETTKEGEGLEALFEKAFRIDVPQVNDGPTDFELEDGKIVEFNQKTPRARILAALRVIKKHKLHLRPERKSGFVF